jgi:hypothetical protein
VLYSQKGETTDTNKADVAFYRGRALLGLGRHHEAVEALAVAYEHSQAHAGDGMWPARASLWYGQALVAAGDTVRGDALIVAARRQLAASRYAGDRRMAAQVAAKR